MLVEKVGIHSSITVLGLLKKNKYVGGEIQNTDFNMILVILKVTINLDTHT